MSKTRTHAKKEAPETPERREERLRAIRDDTLKSTSRRRTKLTEDVMSLVDQSDKEQGYQYAKEIIVKYQDLLTLEDETGSVAQTICNAFPLLAILMDENEGSRKVLWDRKEGDLYMIDSAAEHSPEVALWLVREHPGRLSQQSETGWTLAHAVANHPNAARELLFNPDLLSLTAHDADGDCTIVLDIIKAKHPTLFYEIKNAIQPLALKEPRPEAKRFGELERDARIAKLAREEARKHQ